MVTRVEYFQQVLHIPTSGRDSIDITAQVNAVVAASNIKYGLCHVFIQHTSASLIVCENADPDVRVDLETFMSKLVVDGDPMFIHTDEGIDDMPAHVRTTLTQSDLTLPVSETALALGIWQGVYLWEHRHQPHQRRVTVTVHGQPN